MSRKPGNLIVKDPNSVEPQGFDWSEYLEELGADVEISLSAWSVTGPDAALTLGNDTVLAGGARAQVFLSGGTVGRKYTVTNRITTNTVPPVVDDASFKVLIQQK